MRLKGTAAKEKNEKAKVWVNFICKEKTAQTEAVEIIGI